MNIPKINHTKNNTQLSIDAFSKDILNKTQKVNYQDAVSVRSVKQTSCQKNSELGSLWEDIKKAWNSLAWYEKPLLFLLPFGFGCGSVKKTLPPQLRNAVFGGLVDLGYLEEKKYTIALHLNGDNSLGVSEYDWHNIDQIIEATKDPAVSANANILVLWDDPYEMHAYFYISNGEVKYVFEAGEVNMGRTNTATDFIDYTVERCPAEKYVFIFWNHGNGAAGVSYDDTNSDYLNGIEQKNIIAYFKATIGRKVDLVGYDACLMGSFDVLYQLKDVAELGVASQQLEPATGWQYSFLASLADPALAPRDLAKNIVTAYDQENVLRYTDYTMSAVDLQYADSLAVALDTYSILAIDSGVAGSAYRNLMNATTAFYGSGTVLAIDLQEYMQRVIAAVGLPQNVKDAAQVVSDKVYTDNGIADDYVFFNRRGSAIIANGTSITPSNASYYRLLDLPVVTAWDEFCQFSGF